MLKNIIFNTILLFFLSSCSLYESGGRQAIEKNEGNLVGSYVAGLSANQQHYYVCSRTKKLPDFLSEALEVIETPLETQNISVLLNSRSAPNWVAIYRQNLEFNHYDQCKIYFLKTKKLSAKRILQAAQIGVKKIDEFN